MKKPIISAVLIAVLGTMAVSCQKENIIDSQITVGESVAVYTVHYSVNGVLHSETLIGEQALSDFMQRMLALAEQGYEVTVCNENFSRVAASKEVVTYSTPDHDEAHNWCKQKIKEGYSVTISYDEERHVYNCIAIR